MVDDRVALENRAVGGFGRPRQIFRMNLATFFIHQGLLAACS
jgi:hypothetical protein